MLSRLRVQRHHYQTCCLILHLHSMPAFSMQPKVLECLLQEHVLLAEKRTRMNHAQLTAHCSHLAFASGQVAAL